MKGEEMSGTYEGESDDGLKTSCHFVNWHFDGLGVRSRIIKVQGKW